MNYGGGEFFSGTEFFDQVSFDSGLTIFGQSIGAATNSSGFDDSDGVLGYACNCCLRCCHHANVLIVSVQLA